jgi:Flp pilus assembly protein CpaB
MRPVRIITAAVLLIAAGTGSYIAYSIAGHPAAAPAAPVAAAPTAPPISPATTVPAPQRGGTPGQPVVLADGRHPVFLKAVDADRRTVTFDLVQYYRGDDAGREAAKDHQEADNDYYIRNVSPRLRTLPVPAAATITVNELVGSNQDVPVTLARLATLTGPDAPRHWAMYWITVHHDHVVAVSEQWVP